MTEPLRRSTFLFLSSIATIVAAGLVAYSNTFQVPFLFDDIPRILDETAIRQLWPPTVAMHNTNRPFAHYTFAMNYAVNGYHVWGYHAINLGIHLAASLVLFGIVRRTLQSNASMDSRFAIWVAFVISILWALHPLNTQAVTYIVQRLESLMGLAYLTTLYCFIRSQQSRIGWLWSVMSILACGFGMGCKEVMVTAPIVVLWYDRAYVANSWQEIFTKRSLYYFGLTLTWGVLAWSMLHHSEDYNNGSLINVPGLTSWTYLLSQSSVIVHYLGLAFWPSGQCVYHAWPVARSVANVWPQLLFVTLLLAASLWGVSRYPKASFLGCSFFLILAPTSSIVPIKDLVFEHRMYLPLSIVIASVVMGAYQLLSRLPFKPRLKNQVGLSIALLIAFLLGVTTWERNKVYQSEVSVWTDAVAKSPRNTTVLIGLGGIYSKKNRFEEARECFLKALEIEPDNSKANSNFAGMLIDLREYDLARHYLDRALSLDPKDADAISNMGHLLFDTGNYEKAVLYYQAATNNDPNNEELQSSLVASLIQDGRLDEAISLCEEQVQLRPDSARPHADLGASLAGIGRVAEAIDHCETAIQLDNQLARAHVTLAMLIVERNLDDAILHMEFACSLESNSVEYHRLLANLLSESRPRDAVKYYQKALALSPDDVDLLLRTGMIWDACGEPAKGLPFLERVTELLPNWVEAKQALDSIRQSIHRGTRRPPN